MVLRNEYAPVRTVYFQLPAVMTTDNLRFDGGGEYSVRQLGTYLQVTFAEPIANTGAVRLAYKGSIRPSGPFDLAVRGKVLNSAFFLSDADVLIKPRSTGCLDASGARAGRAPAEPARTTS